MRRHVEVDTPGSEPLTLPVKKHDAPLQWVQHLLEGLEPELARQRSIDAGATHVIHA